MSNDLNTAVAYERGSLRTSSQALSTAWHSLELAMASPALVRLVDKACELAERYIIIRAAHQLLLPCVSNTAPICISLLILHCFLRILHTE